jgi:uncharacterized protein (DUF952 family)/lysophospholipase L1-like esterase
VTLHRYVAIGDSQTEGLLDPDGSGGFRGWADRFADHLADQHPHLQYANLAVRGRRIGAIRAEQLGPALALQPDVATVMAGMNDLIHPSWDLDAVLSDLDAMLDALVAAGATVLTNTYPDIAQVAPLFARLAPRFVAYNDGIRAVAGQRGALVVDFAEHDAGTDPRIWSPDRIHANPLGHALMAAAFADTFGLPGAAGWRDPLPPLIRPGRVRRAVVEVRWVAGTVLPWAVRRVRGRSSGDGRRAKRPELLPVAPLFHLLAPGQWPATGDYRPPSLSAEGFVHLSFADQVEGSANRHYAGAAQLEAVQLDPRSVGVPVRVEDSYGSGTAFPHAYGPLPVGAAVAVHPMRRVADGGWLFSRDGAGAAASPDR